MTDTRPSRTAREKAIAHIQAVRDFWYPTPPTPGCELDDIPTDLLRRLADERTMAKQVWITPTEDMWQDNDGGQS